MWYIVINKILFQLLIFFISIVDKSNKKKIISFFQKKFNLNPINVIDIGAHKGETIDLFLENFNISKIYSFEPNINLFNYLINKKYDNKKIILMNFGVGKIEEKKELNIFKDTSSSTLNSINENTEYYKRKRKIMDFFLPNENFLSHKQTINVCNLTQFIRDKKICKIDILKIDTEGFEFNIINGINQKDFKKIKFIYFEHHYDLMINKNYKFSDINRLLKKNNFYQKFKLRMKYRKSFEYIYENSKK
jgi:FkbM family methyltransferase